MDNQTPALTAGNGTHAAITPPQPLHEALRAQVAELYSIANTLRLAEAALNSDAAERLIETCSIQSELITLEARIESVGEQLEQLAMQRSAAGVPGGAA